MFKKKVNVLFLLLLFLRGILVFAQTGEYEHGKKQGVWVETREIGDKHYPKITQVDSGYYDHGVKTGVWVESRYYPRSCSRLTGTYKLGRREGWWLNYNVDYSPDSIFHLVQKMLYRNDTIMETYSFAPVFDDTWQKRYWQIYEHHYLSAGGDTTFFVEYYTTTKADSGKVRQRTYWSAYGKLNALPTERPKNALRYHYEMHYGNTWSERDSFLLENKVSFVRYRGHREAFYSNTATGPFKVDAKSSAKDSLKGYFYFENDSLHFLPGPIISTTEWSIPNRRIMVRSPHRAVLTSIIMVCLP